MKIQQHYRLILILGALIALSPFSIDMYLPAFPAIAISLKTDIATVGYSLTSYYAGLCTGQLVYGILIDHFGRKKPLMVGLLIYLFSAMCCAFSPDIDIMIMARLFMALGGCVGMVAARAVVRDFFPPEDTAKILSILVLVMGVAPIIAPTIGGVVNTSLGWRWVFGVMSLIAASLLVAVRWCLPETKVADVTVTLKPGIILSGYISIVRQRTFLVYALAGGISYAGMYAYIADSPFVFMQYFGFSAQVYGWIFAFNACGLILGSQLNRLFLKYFDGARISFHAAVLLFVTGLFLLLASLCGIAGIVVIMICTFVFLGCLGFINPNAIALALKPFSDSAGRASAVLGSMQMIAGVLASWLVSFFHNGSIVVMPAVMFGCAALTLMLLLAVLREKKSNKVPHF